MSEELVSPLTYSTLLPCISSSNYNRLRLNQMPLCDCTGFIKTRLLPFLVLE